ncbi:hypothetical protein B9Q08_02230 [Candidatus Marsarchaeota G2 archaeon ECH_B_SAG-M15]|uniref:HTH arsR-type domain-containing protein n=1 Tax=Candidatus Marsarchaeota G2 archaeon ECH_B_SAG-M15 TaxID=1978162 RepID=A0A2R6AZF9_9ARCH|nr:MAG: hypothetical protein B9Q08_02230 [Candidatus Marsarchaeota G2 archaeon ECH_B_SAG-M15]
MVEKTVGELLEPLVREGGVLANELRLLIYLVVRVRGRCTWSQILADVEKATGRRVNPNALSFHLKLLLDSGLVSKESAEYVAGREPALKPEILAQAAEGVRTLLGRDAA